MEKLLENPKLIHFIFIVSLAVEVLKSFIGLNFRLSKGFSLIVKKIGSDLILKWAELIFFQFSFLLKNECRNVLQIP